MIRYHSGTSTPSHLHHTHNPQLIRCPGIRSHHFGPGVKVIGGEVRYVYEERTSGKAKLDTTQGQDPAQMIAHMMSVPDTLQRPQPGTLCASLSRTHTQQHDQQQQAQQQEAQTASISGFGISTSSTSGSGLTKKIVFWDGKSHSTMDHTLAIGQTGKQGQGAPHLEQRDLAPGPFLGVRETPGSMPTRIIGSKHRCASGHEILPVAEC